MEWRTTDITCGACVLEMVWPRRLRRAKEIEAAARSAFAAVLVGLAHVNGMLGYSYIDGGSSLRVITVALAVLCSCGTVGGTIEFANHAIAAAIGMLPVGGMILWCGRFFGANMQPALSIALLAVSEAAICLLKLHGVARKTVLALTAGSVLQFVQHQPTNPILPALLAASVAVITGTMCALLAALLPFPRSATVRADAAIHAGEFAPCSDPPKSM